MTDFDDSIFRDRLRYLRNQKNISAREMSLELEQNETYINKIETGKCSVSISAFFKICRFLEVTPKEFFDFEVNNLIVNEETFRLFKKLSSRQAKCICELMKDLAPLDSSK